MAGKRKRGPFGGGGSFAAGGATKYRKTGNVKIPGVIPGYTRRVGSYGKYVAGRGELKFWDIDIDEANIPEAGSVIQGSCNKIPQGTGESERIGRKCTIKKITWKVELARGLANQTADTPAGDAVRLILYVDKQTNGDPATVGQILHDLSYLSHRNLAQETRFRILMDSVYHMNYQGGAGEAVTKNWPGFTRNFTRNFTVSIPIEYNGTTGVMDEIKCNNIGILAISASSGTAMASKIRLRFND